MKQCKRFFISLIIVIFYFLMHADLVFALTSESNTVITRVGNPVVSSTDISQCTFYREGDAAHGVSGLKIGNPKIAAMITEVATKVGVPASIVAGIMRVETASALATTGSTYVAGGVTNNIDADYDAHTSGVAYGVMQFVPTTFTGVFNANKDAMSSLFGKTSVKATIDPQGSIASDSVLRIYSIKDSIIATAFKVKMDNPSGLWTRENVDKVARAYYGGLAYTGGNYGEDLWKSYINCQSTAGTGPVAPPKPGANTCPIPRGTGNDGIVTCGPSKPVRTQYPSCNAGHCAGNYGFPSWCRDHPATSYAVDIPGQPNQNVVMPQLTIPSSGDVHPLTCQSKYLTSGGGAYSIAQIIIPFQCRDDIDGTPVWIQFHHMLAGSAPAYGTRIVSGQTIGKIEPDRGGSPPFPHTHVQIGINGECLGSNIAACVGADKYLQCK